MKISAFLYDEEDLTKSIKVSAFFFPVLNY